MKNLICAALLTASPDVLHATESPIPERPAMGSINYPPHPHFRWQREADVKIDEVHRIQIARDEAFKDVISDDRLQVVSRFVPVKPLAPGNYWWRVRRGESDWSKAVAFEVRMPQNVYTVRKGAESAAVARMLKEAALHAPARVNFEPGRYALAPSSGKSLAIFDKIEDVIIDGQGSQLVLGGPFIRMLECRRVTIQNFTVTSNKSGHTLVRIIRKDPASGRLVVKPEPGFDPDVPHYFGKGNGGSFLGCMDAAHRGKYLIGAGVSAQSKNPPSVTQSPDDPSAFVFSPVDAATLDRCPIGAPAIITAYQWQWIEMVDGAENTLSHITVSDLPGAFSGGSGSSAKSYLECKVKCAPRDYFGGHSACGSGRIGEWIEGCEFECLPDDGPAEQSFRMSLTGADGPDAVLMNGSLERSRLRAGDRVALFDSKIQHGASATVLNVSQAAKGVRVQLDHHLAEVATSAFIYVDSPSNEDFVYRHNRHFGGRGHGVKFNGTRGWIADSIFENINGNAVMSGYLSELSGHGSSDVLISGNTIVRCGWTPIASTSKSHLGRNLIIRDNRISEVRDAAIFVKGYTDVTITGNEFTSTTQPTAGAWVHLQDSSNVSCKVNRFPSELPEIRNENVH